ERCRVYPCDRTVHGALYAILARLAGVGVIFQRVFRTVANRPGVRDARRHSCSGLGDRAGVNRRRRNSNRHQVSSVTNAAPFAAGQKPLTTPVKPVIVLSLAVVDLAGMAKV